MHRNATNAFGGRSLPETNPLWNLERSQDPYSRETDRFVAREEGMREAKRLGDGEEGTGMERTAWHRSTHFTELVTVKSVTNE